MTEIDLDRLGDVWRAQPDPAEIERLRRAAETVQRRARWGQFTDVFLAILVSAVVLSLIVSNPRVDTGLVGGAAILFMLFSTARQRRLRALELATLGRSTEQMLDQSIERAQATAKRAWLNILLAGPGLLLGIGFGAMLNRGSGSSMLSSLTAHPFAASLAAMAMTAVVAGFCVHFLRIRGRALAEIGRLSQLRQSYDAESAAE